ncbi:transcriptional regulator [Mesotoga sp. B105.6.4]|nr:transcriptional regulator [Mesotoga sp. B105.6.4]
MVGKKLDSENIGRSNRKLILHLLRKSPVTTRRDLAIASGLNPSTITKIIKDFLSVGLCEEVSAEETGRIGRKAIVLRLNRKAFMSIVIDIGVEETTVGKGFFDGSVSVMSKFRTPPDFYEFMKILAEKASIISKNIPKYRFLGYSVSVPGIVDVENSRIVYVPHLNWKDLVLRERLSRRYPVFLDNEANLSLIAEKWNNPALANAGDIVFVYVSEGIGCGIMFDGQIYRGRDYSAGELGHMTVQTDGKQCYCGNFGCWETIASTEAIVGRAEEMGFALRGSSNNEKYLGVLSSSDPEYKYLLEEVERSLGVGIINIVNSLDPEVVVLGGVASMLPERSLRNLVDLVNSRVLYATGQNIRVIRSVLHEKGRASSKMIGAALHIIDKKTIDFV